ncbi:reticulon-3 isoform X3 [Ictalurus punctatus]|uniref:Reticulon n=1 Tax=Ictalurus punctatus TaxID=7998 RepID=A0A2D0RAP4_ICTPU|nr:reticulon-3 isoform X3 [Ictalurus punctatus]
MADPMTQSHQISSSQGLNDGRAKDSKFSDSFFSSSPVSLIQSPQDKRVALDSEKPSDGVPTSLRFSSQPSSFSPANYGNDNSIPSIGIKDRSFQEKRELFESSLGSQKQDSSPIKISPVSERIRALEALAAKQNDSDWSDAGFPHFRERHYEKSHSEIHGITLRSSIKKKPTSSEQDSPESPFEILGDARRGSDFEDTADWMRAHLPPAPNFNIGESDFDQMKERSVMPECPSDETKSKDTDVQGIPSSFVGVPDEFMDNPDEVSKQMNDDSNQSKQDTIEDETEFDLRFLPTAYMWDKQEKPDMDTQEPPFHFETPITASAAPPDGFEASSLESPTPVPQADPSAKQQSTTLGVGLEGVEILEADSSGESDDTVIEDASGVSNDDAVECKCSTDEQTIPSVQEKQSMQVPIINVIETEEQVLSDYEVELEEEEDDEQRYQIMQEPATEAPQSSEELSDISRSELEETVPKMEDISSPENMTDSNGEYSPKHKIIKDNLSNDTINQTSLPSKSHSSEDSQTQSMVPQKTDEMSREASFDYIKSDKTSEIVPDLPPNYEDLSNDFESSDIDTYLDHYSSEELALKDQLSSGVITVNNGDTNELLKSNSLQHSHNNTMLAEFDEADDASKQNYDTGPKPFPAIISADVTVEPLLSQNSVPNLELDDQSLAIEDKMITDSGTFSLTEEEDYMTRHEVELPSFQESTPAEFPSFHNDPSCKISDVISDFVASDLTEGLLMTNTEQDKIIQYDDPRSQISPEATIIPEPVEAESEQNKMVQSDIPDIQISEEPTKTPEPVEEESEQNKMVQSDIPDIQISEQPTKIPEPVEEESEQNKMVQSDIPDIQISEEPANIPELIEAESEQNKMVQHDTPDTQISEEPANIPEPIEAESEQNKMVQSDTPDTKIPEEPTNIPEPIEAEAEQDEIIQCNAPDIQISLEIPSKLESTEAESSTTATDSFVEFMRECLKSQQDEESRSLGSVQTTKEPISVAPSPPAMIMDLEQECLTISALKELGSSHEEQDDISIPKDIPISDKDPVSQPLFQSESLICPNPSTHGLPNENQPDASLTKEIEAIDIWVAEAYHLAEHVLALILTHLTVYDLVYWRDPKKSGMVFGISLLLLLSLAAFSVISVISYLLLALLCVTISFRVYKTVIQAVQKSNDGHPFKELMEKDVSLSPETFRKHVDVCLTYINCALKQLSRLFLVEDLVDSLKLAVVMWLMTYVGAVFNGITILILVDILAFTLPPLYEKYKTQIDRYVNIARTQVNTAVAKIQEKLPKAAKRSKAE